MTTINKSLATFVALAVLSTAGAESSYAQRGKSFRGLFQGGSSNNGGSNRSGGNNLNFSNLNNVPKLRQSNNNNSLQNFGNTIQTQQNRFGNRFGQFQNANQNKNTPNLGINNNNLQQFGGNRLNNNRLQQFLNNNNKGTNGLQTLINKNKLQTKDVKVDGLQKFLGNQNLIGGNKDLIGGNQNQNGGGGLQQFLNSNTGSKLFNLIKHNHTAGKVCIDHDHWCHTKPKHCHWWYNWCKPLAYCEPHHHVHCHWDYVTCDYIVGGHVVLADARWYLGLKGLYLPGQGVGVEEVKPGSPAAAVGLLPGMVITHVNGIALVDETVLGQVIEQSGGVLQMDLRLNADGAPATCIVVMQRVASVSY